MRVKYVLNNNNRIKTFIIGLIIILINSCETEINSEFYNQSEPVVNCLINPYDSIHYVKLTRTFSGGDDVRKIAKMADSLYYKDATINLEIWSNKGWAFYRKPFEKIIDINKERGYFNSDENSVFKLVDDFSFYFHGIVAKLNLTIDIPSENKIASAVAQVYQPVEIINPKEVYNLALNLYSPDPMIIECEDRPEFALYEITLRIYYTEGRTNSLTDTYIDIIKNRPSLTDTTFNTVPNYKLMFDPDNFYLSIASKIPNDPEIRYRKFKHIDIMLQAAPKELKDYIEIGKITADNIGKPYTNIVNGLGIFICYYEDAVRHLKLNYRTADSLRFGRFTKHLNFVFWD